MQTIEKAVNPGFEVKYLSIDARVLLRLIQSQISEKESFSAKIGESWDAKHYLTDNIDDAMSHHILFKPPFSISFDDVTLRVNSWNCSIQYEGHAAAAADAFYQKLVNHRKAIRHLDSMWLPGVLAAAAAVTLAYFLKGPFAEPWGYFLTSMGIFLPIAAITFGSERPKITHKTGDGFVARNKDQLLLLVLGAAIGWLMGLFSPDSVKEWVSNLKPEAPMQQVTDDPN